MEIVFYVILYAIIGGISAGVFLYFKNKRSRYENRYDIDDVYLDGLLWPFSLPCFIIVEILTISKKD